MSPGTGLRGRRNRREIINYRVNENSQTHGQIPGAVVNRSYNIRLLPEADSCPPRAPVVHYVPGRTTLTLRHCPPLTLAPPAVLRGLAGPLFKCRGRPCS